MTGKGARLPQFLQLLEELTARARDKDSAGNVAFAVLYTLHDAGRLAAFGAIRAFGCVHDLLAVCCLGNFHDDLLTKPRHEALADIPKISGVILRLAQAAGTRNSPGSILHESGAF